MTNGATLCGAQGHNWRAVSGLPHCAECQRAAEAEDDLSAVGVRVG